MSGRPSIYDKRECFRRLHETGCFVMPNPWNVGTAVYLQHLGFKAIATTSAGFAHAQGRPDGGVALDVMLAHLAEMTESVDVPVNADFEGGFAMAPADVAQNVTLCVQSGIAGLSIEDASGDPARPLYDFDLTMARVRAARVAIDGAGGDVVLTARSEGFIRGYPNLEEAVRRIRGFIDAGADCVYVPGIVQRAQIEAIAAAAQPLPVNVLCGGATEFTVDVLAAMGVRRISVGGALARVAMTAFVNAARELAREGRFTGFRHLISNTDFNALFELSLEKRERSSAM